ncbi:MAG: NAD-dependent epimerase/dehydratase family protein [Planctomycetota bacterium]|jgi:GDP-L-fucose synthase
MTDFYQDKDVVILGGAGFVGRHLCRALEERGANVFVVDNLSRHSEQEKVEDVEWFKVDISRSLILAKVIAHCNPFAVFNLAAAVAGVEYNQKHHNEMFTENVVLQTVPVMVCEQFGVPHFLQVSSACVYGADANAPGREDNLGGEPVAANAGYSWAKRMGERAVQWSKLNHAVIVRPSNIYGPGDWYDERAHVIPKLIKGYDQRTAKLFGGGKAIREFLYVEDAAEGMIYALEHGANKEAYNLGGEGIPPSMADLHSDVRALMGTAYVAPDIPSEFDQGDDVRFSDHQKLRGLGFRAETRMHDGLKKTIEAYFETK